MITEAFTADAIRAAERRSPRLATGELMQAAAAAVARVALAELDAAGIAARGARVLIVAGPGNNGGDGLFAGARLAARGLRVSFWLTGEGGHEAGLAALRAAGGREVDAVAALEALPDVDLVIDAIAGIGGRPGLAGAALTFAQACDALAVPVLAVDVPSGVAADSCAATDCVRAATTVTFGAAKPCHLMQPARQACGRVEVVDLGLELGEPALRAFSLADLCAHLPKPGPTSSKYTRGVLGIDTGSPEFIGAGILSTTGAAYAGAGMIRFVGPKAGPVRLALPNVVTARGQVQAWLLGCGWGQREDAAEVVARALADGVPVVVDADALHPDTLPQRLRPDVLLTPHAGELARLLGRDRKAVEADPLGAVADAVANYGAAVLLKGATQYVAAPGFPTTIALPGPFWTGQAGSGDVLAGVCGALLAGGVDAPHAALCAASLQALAADRRRGPYPPQDVAREIAPLIAELVGQ